uniref:hypothetical protein n=1 Tax=Trichocoleus desertorum TaxID=1481672 RepID=UPI0025B2F77A|nr:hypothetical protein [Trichocoleus desertorum]
MTQPKTILTAAHDIRPHLTTLLDPETAQQVEQQLQTLLTQAESGQSVEISITEVLRHLEPTQEWTRRYLKGENPEQITRSISGYSGLVGDPRSQSATKYVCPHNNCPETWYRENNSTIPLCPNHLIALIPNQP